MSVAYIGLNIKDFIANTVRLSTEAKGAYLMLLLDYYEQEVGPPADPEVLATITGLSLEAWQRHSRVILPLFEINPEGNLYQQRIEDEIAKAHQRISQASKAGAAAKSAREARKKGSQHLSENNAGTEAKIQPDVLPEQPPVLRPAREIREILSRATASSTDSTSDRTNGQDFQGTITKKEEVSANALTARAGEEPPAEAVFETLLPEDFALSAADVIRCQNDGATAEQIAAVFDGWKLRMLANGTFAADWSEVWWRRWERDKPVKAKPRIEVSNKKPKAKGFPLPEDWEPNDLHRQRAQERGIIGRDFDDLVETFRDYCNQAANRTKYSDHDGAFRTFIKNQNTFNRGTNGSTATRRAPPPSRGSIVGAADEAIANLERKIAGGDQGGEETF